MRVRTVSRAESAVAIRALLGKEAGATFRAASKLASKPRRRKAHKSSLTVSDSERQELARIVKKMTGEGK